MIETDLQLKSEHGHELFAHTWEPNNTPKAAIVLVHGFGEHCLRYTPYFETFVNNGIAILGFDHQGHGQNKGQRGVVHSYASMLDDIGLSVAKTKELYPNIPQFVYGHSMGGNLALNYLIQHKPDIQGGIITSPWLTLSNGPNAVLKFIVDILGTVAPNLTVVSNLNVNHISTIKEEVEKYKTDPLNHGKISLNLLKSITSSGLSIIDNIQEINIPVLLFHGSNDMITSPTSSKAAKDGNPEKIEFKEWDNAYHELHNDFCRADVGRNIMDWINTQIK